MKVLLFLLGVAVGVNLFYFIATAKPPKPVIQSFVETKYVTLKEYIRLNQTEPMNMIVTAYTAGPESTGKRPRMKGYGITKTGTQAKIGVCAVDPDYIPLGTSLFVEGYGYCRAEDTGAKIKGYHIDVFMYDVTAARKFGREQRKVWILKDYEEGEV